VNKCIYLGLNCIAITDHNTIQGAIAVKELAPFTVIIGEEISTAGGDLVGLFLEEEVPSGLTALETVRRIKDQGGLVSIPHPFDRLRSSVISPEALEDILPHTDIIEVFNARNISKKADERALELARIHGVTGTAVSDAHTLMELGQTFATLSGFDGSSQGFLDSLRQGTLTKSRSSPLVHLFTLYNKLTKRLLKR
jgi:predicted metal-dependent phosphoesterase TrpH